MNYVNRPNRLETANKDEQYHVDYARWILNTSSSSMDYGFNYKSIVNWSFYKGDQWLFAEDLDAFLMDESGDVRNRLKFVQNIIRPFVEYYRGSAIRLNMTYRAESVSANAIDRRELALGKLHFMQWVADNSPNPEISKKLREKFPIGATVEETNEIFMNLYRDEFEEDINLIVRKIADDNNFDELKKRLAEHLAIDGIGILKNDGRYGTQTWSAIHPRTFIRDMSAKQPDLKDSEFMGDWQMASVTDVLEQAPQISFAKKVILENATSMGYQPFSAPHNIFIGDSLVSGGKVPVYRFEWRDVNLEKWGVFMDEQDNPVLLELTEGGGRKRLTVSEMWKYAPENAWIEKLFKEGNKLVAEKKILCDQLRYCEFVPSEFISGVDGNDIVLNYGISPHQTKYSYQYKEPDWMYKVYCWGYDCGEILAPIDDLIWPQRFINRVLSMGESQVNNLRGSGLIYDKDSLGKMKEEELQRNVNLGKPIGLEANGQLNNAISSYNNQLGTGTIQLFDVAANMKKISDNIIGGGDALMGQGGAYRASATVAQQNLNQGTTMQEPVFWAISSIIKDSYECMANKGRRILASNQNAIPVVVGEKGTKIIKLTKDYNYEEFKMRMVVTNNPAQERDAANNMLLALLDKQLIDQDTVAKYFNKATLADIGKAIREYAAKRIEIARVVQIQQEDEQNKMADAANAEMKLQGVNQDQQMMLEQQKIAASMQAKAGAQQQQPTSVGQAKVYEAALERQPEQQGLF